MGKRIGLALVYLVICVVLFACGPGQTTQEAQQTKIAIRSRATLKAKALPTLTWTPGPSPTSTLSPALAGTPPGAPSPFIPPPSSLPATAPPPASSPVTTLPPTTPSVPAPTSAPSFTVTPSADLTSTAPVLNPTVMPTLTLAPTPSPASPPPRLVFASNRDGNYEIYTMNDDGSGLTRLTNDPAEDSRPSWSPDGTRIAFDSDRSGNYDIYVMNVQDALQGTDGYELIRLTDDPAPDLFPTWSPDGSRIAFVSLRDEPDLANCDPNCNWEIYVMNADGGGVTRLTNDPAEDFSPAWSPDGTRIAFDSDRDGSYDIYVVNVPDALQGVESQSRSGAGGGEAINVTNDPTGSVSPAWSPDGTRLAFASVRDDPDPYNCSANCNWEIYVMLLSAGEGGVTRLTGEPAADDDAAWSPDGLRIAFVSWRDGNAEIYLMNVQDALQGVESRSRSGADGSGLTRLTNDPADDWDVAWSPW